MCLCMGVCVCVFIRVCACLCVCERFFCLFLFKNKQVKPKNDVSNEGRGDSLYHTSLGTCLHHRPGRSMFSEWACGVVNRGARPPKASD